MAAIRHPTSSRSDRSIPSNLNLSQSTTSSQPTSSHSTSSHSTSSQPILPYLSSLPTNKHAYVWLLMKGDSYLPGIFTSVYSVLRTNPDADLVVMITGDVSRLAQITLLKVATHLFHIDYISFKSKQMKTERQRKMYGTWIASSYSKWNALALPYEKIILIDGDTIHTENTDELFDMKAPAMPLASPFVEPLGAIHSHYHEKTGLDGYPLHNTRLTVQLIDDILNQGGVLPTSTPAVITPSITDYKAYLAETKSLEPFGFVECHSGFDEQSISHYYAKSDISYTSVHQRYNYYPWKDGFLFDGDVPKIIHFFSDTKPWMVSFDKYPDVTTWYKMAGAALKHTFLNPTDIKLKKSDIDGAALASDTFIKKFIDVTDVLDVYGKLKLI